jgi:hypothetical protein
MGGALCIDPEAASKKGIMKPNAGKEYNKILINHWRWLEQQGPSYKQQATSCKLQAASLTRRLNSVIGVYRRKNYENK